MESTNKILEKISKLMAHQQSALEMGSTAEAEAFALKIQKLMNQYNISLGDITVDKRADEMMDADFALKIPSIGGRTNFQIFNAIAKNNWCRAYIIGSARNNRMIIVGTPKNIDMCRYIHSVVLPVFMSVGKKKYKEEYLVQIEDENAERMLDSLELRVPVGFDTFMRTFITGCAHGLDAKLSAEMEQFVKENSTEEAIAEIGCSALVLVGNNLEAIKSYTDKKFGKSGRAKSSKLNHAGGAYEKGVETGKNVKIAKGVAGSAPVARKALN